MISSNEERLKGPLACRLETENLTAQVFEFGTARRTRLLNKLHNGGKRRIGARGHTPQVCVRNDLAVTLIQPETDV